MKKIWLKQSTDLPDEKMVRVFQEKSDYDLKTLAIIYPTDYGIKIVADSKAAIFIKK
jgi:hypothetical protein